MPDKQKGRAPGNSKSGNQSGHIVEPSNQGSGKGKSKEGVKPASPDQDMSNTSTKRSGK